MQMTINGDTLTTLSFPELINYHKTNGATATIALKKRETYIDFGIVELDNTDWVKGYTEKPTINHLVSMGVNVLEPKVLDYIKLGEKLDFPDLIKILISKGEAIKGFVLDGYWLDIGRPDDYEKANEDIGELNKILNF